MKERRSSLLTTSDTLRLIPSKSLRGRYCHVHLTDEKTEAPKGYKTCPKSPTGKYPKSSDLPVTPRFSSFKSLPQAIFLGPCHGDIDNNPVLQMQHRIAYPCISEALLSSFSRTFLGRPQQLQ
uniref:Uncharacterized protein n=1 Tax=Myotis myotis TaxID=51298 RepID=A0A7J7TTN9_MYOMY|nr:hypothetical protein mMyoMyo1_008945 [Myotis myotis]